MADRFRINISGIILQARIRMVAEISYYHFITIIWLQYNYLASEDQNGSGRSAITIWLQ